MNISSQTISQALAAAVAQGLERLDAQLLLLYAVGQPLEHRAWLLTHDTDLLDDAAVARFAQATQRRAAGEPVAYIAGTKAFYGLSLQVDARVLVPRPDTETLVTWALEVAQEGDAVIDLGTGSGAIALALKSQRPKLFVTALDISADALAVAGTNAARLGIDVAFMQGNWLDDRPDSASAGGLKTSPPRYDLIVSNPPYIAAGDTHLAALAHEPLQALASGADGLDAIRKIIHQAPAHLNSGGWLLLEHGYDQAQRVRDLLASAGFQNAESRRDLAGIERCSGGQAPP